jgi:hypothetical protein
MIIYDMFAGGSAVIGIISGSYLLWRAWINRIHVSVCCVLVLSAAAILWYAAIYSLSLMGVQTLQTQTLVIGMWLRPATPFLLASPSLIVRVVNL